LRRAFVAFDHHSLVHDSRIQIGTNQPDDIGALHLFPKTVDQDVVIDSVEELRQVNVHHDAKAVLYMLLCCEHRITCTPAGPEPVAVLTKGHL
jgi:hypothetical protein